MDKKTSTPNRIKFIISSTQRLPGRKTQLRMRRMSIIETNPDVELFHIFQKISNMGDINITHIS